MNNREIIVLNLLCIFALAAGILAIVLPFWVSTEVDNGVQEVQVNKKIDSGLWWKYERFEAKQESFKGSDDWWTNIAATSMDTKGLKIVTGLMMTGMAVLNVGVICTIVVTCYSCCFRKCDLTIPFSVLTVMFFIAAVFIASGVTVFFKQVLDDYEIGEDDDHLGVSFWLAVASSVTTFLTGIFTCYQARCNGEDTLK